CFGSVLFIQWCCHTSGAFLNDRLTPVARFNPVEPFPVPSEPTLSSERASCRFLTTGIPGKAAPAQGVGEREGVVGQQPQTLSTPLTRCNQLRLVFLIGPHILILHVSPREEEAHHPPEELVGELDGERHHIHLQPHGKSFRCRLSITQSPTPSHPDSGQGQLSSGTFIFTNTDYPCV
uniref:Uncharacterized protein n=1 Tax=Callorhinchus milii TaxID=7868 RepID=A0A4W3IMT5_CALMI